MSLATRTFKTLTTGSTIEWNDPFPSLATDKQLSFLRASVNGAGGRLGAMQYPYDVRLWADRKREISNLLETLLNVQESVYGNHLKRRPLAGAKRLNTFIAANAIRDAALAELDTVNGPSTALVVVHLMQRAIDLLAVIVADSRVTR